MKTFINSLYASRPFLWVNTAFPFAVGWIAVGPHSAIFPLIIGCLFFLYPYNLAMYGINDIFDYESDIKNPRKASVEGAQLQKNELSKLWDYIAIANVPFIAYLITTGSWTSGLMLAFSLFMVVAYSAVPFRFKEIAFLDSFTSSCHFVTPFLFGILYAGGSLTTYTFAIIAFFLWGMASHSFGAIQDITYDRQAHIGSIATVLGARSTIIFCTALYIACATTIIFAYQNIFGLSMSLMALVFAATTARFFYVNDETAHETNNGWHTFMALSMATGALFVTGFIYAHGALPWYGPVIVTLATFAVFQKILKK